MGVVFTHDVTDDARAFFVAPVIGHSQIRHAVQNPAMNRLQAVTYVGQGPADDNRHGVVEVRLRYLVDDFSGLSFSW